MPKKFEKSKDFRGIVRILGKDMKGEFPIAHGLSLIKGIGSNLARVFSKAVFTATGIKPSFPVGELSDEQIKKVEEVLLNPSKNGVPSYLFNRRAEFESGETKHLFTNDLNFAVRQDIQRAKDIVSWKGWRMTLGQKVRGQRNRSTGRSGMAVGVQRKAEAKGGGQGGAPGAPAKDEKKK